LLFHDSFAYGLISSSEVEIENQLFYITTGKVKSHL